VTGQPATPSLVRAINLRTTFDVVHAGGSLGAPEVVRQTGLSRPTVADCLSQLLGLGLIRRSGRARGLPGPGAQLYEVEPRAGWVLGLDVGRRWVRAALSNFTGATVATAAAPTSDATPETLITQLHQMSERLTLDAGVDLDAVDQVVLGTPGVIRPGETHFSLAPNLPGWESPEVVDEIREALAAPVAFENDINLAAIGEEVAGVARGVRDFVVISIGTGVGMGVVLDGEVRHGAGGLAGEIAYLTLDLDRSPAAPAPAWGAGAFESLVSAGAILALARAQGRETVRSAADVFALTRAGDTAAAEVVGTVARRLAHGIAAVAAVLDPELVVLGGGVGSGAGDLLVPRIIEALAAISPFSPRLAVSNLGADAVLTGAAAMGLRLAIDRVFERSDASPRGVLAPSWRTGRAVGAGVGR
jgi:predicted NBD/HSP70 family sugar kinase